MPALTIGVAGYMGSGKTTAAQYLAGISGVCINADVLAKEVMNRDRQIQRKLAAAFGPQVVHENRVVAHELGKIVFTDPGSLKILNAIVHPPVLEELDSRVKAVRRGLCIVDAALIPIWPVQTWFSTLVWIEASAETRFARLCQRLTLEPAEIRQRMQQQESLFPPPQSAAWRTIVNETTEARLHAALDALKAELKIV